MKVKHFVATIVFLLGMVIVPFLFWLGGFDFNERGETAALCALASLVCSGLGVMLVFTSGSSLS